MDYRSIFFPVCPNPTSYGNRGMGAACIQMMPVVQRPREIADDVEVDMDREAADEERMTEHDQTCSKRCIFPRPEV